MDTLTSRLLSKRNALLKSVKRSQDVSEEVLLQPTRQADNVGDAIGSSKERNTISEDDEESDESIEKIKIKLYGSMHSLKALGYTFEQIIEASGVKRAFLEQVYIDMGIPTLIQKKSADCVFGLGIKGNDSKVNINTGTVDFNSRNADAQNRGTPQEAYIKRKHDLLFEIGMLMDREKLMMSKITNKIEHGEYDEEIYHCDNNMRQILGMKMEMESTLSMFFENILYRNKPADKGKESATTDGNNATANRSSSVPAVDIEGGELAEASEASEGETRRSSISSTAPLSSFCTVDEDKKMGETKYARKGDSEEGSERLVDYSFVQLQKSRPAKFTPYQSIVPKKRNI